MARGDIIVFNELIVDMGAKAHAMASDSWKMALITSLPVVGLATPRLADFTEVSGGGYTAGGILLTGVAFSNSGADTTFLWTNAPTWNQTAGGAGSIKAALVYNDTDASKRAALAYDLTTDGGTTAISLNDGQIIVNINASGGIRFRRL